MVTWLFACVAGMDVMELPSEPDCTVMATFRGDLNVSFPSEVTCQGSSGSGSGVDGVDFSTGGIINSDRLSLSIELVNWLPGPDGEVIENLSTLVEVADREAGTTWRSISAFDEDPAGCQFSGTVEITGPFDAPYLGGTATCSRSLEEFLGDGTLDIEGAIEFQGLGPVP